MNGKQKLYFLLDAIDDARTIAPNGQAVVIDPLNDLNDQIRQIELVQMFTKLERDEQVISILKEARREKSVVDDLDPYDYSDDGCWHVEVLPAFDSYLYQIQQESEYQEFTGKKPGVSIVKSGNGSLMTYEEKLDRIVKALVEAKKATRKDQQTVLFINANTGLDCMDIEEIRNILYQLQDEKALEVVEIINRLVSLSQQPKFKDRIYLKVNDNFNEWYASYLFRNQSNLKNLNWINILRVLDVCNDIDQELQMSRTVKVSIASFPYPYLGRFIELFPFDSQGTRQNYQNHRWEGVLLIMNTADITNRLGTKRMKLTVS